ncbi:unnamed protein product [Caretta caretta]
MEILPQSPFCTSRPHLSTWVILGAGEKREEEDLKTTTCWPMTPRRWNSRKSDWSHMYFLAGQFTFIWPLDFNQQPSTSHVLKPGYYGFTFPYFHPKSRELREFP